MLPPPGLVARGRPARGLAARSGQDERIDDGEEPAVAEVIGVVGQPHEVPCRLVERLGGDRPRRWTRAVLLERIDQLVEIPQLADQRALVPEE